MQGVSIDVALDGGRDTFSVSGGSLDVALYDGVLSITDDSSDDMLIYDSVSQVQMPFRLLHRVYELIPLGFRVYGPSTESKRFEYILKYCPMPGAQTHAWDAVHMMLCAFKDLDHKQLLLPDMLRDS